MGPPGVGDEEEEDGPLPAVGGEDPATFLPGLPDEVEPVPLPPATGEEVVPVPPLPPAAGEEEAAPPPPAGEEEAGLPPPAAGEEEAAPLPLEAINAAAAADAASAGEEGEVPAVSVTAIQTDLHHASPILLKDDPVHIGSIHMARHQLKSVSVCLPGTSHRR